MSRETDRPITRSEAKQQSRQRLLDAALRLLDEHGEAALTTTAITVGAGLAQSSFYVHFSSVDELLRELVNQVWEERRATSRRIRAAAIDQSMHEFLRVRFHSLVTGLVEYPSILRLVLRSRLEPGTLMGADAREQQQRSRDAFVEWLAELGAPTATEADRRRLEMVAQGLQAVSDGLALSYTEGKYPDLDEILDVLVWLSEQVHQGLRADPWGASPGTVGGSGSPCPRCGSH